MAGLQSKAPLVEKRTSAPDKKRAPIKQAPIPRPALVIQRKATCACGGGCPRCEQNATHASVNEVQKQTGYPLDTENRGYFEPRLGRDLGQVRIHNDSSSNDAARDMKARAFTVGQEIHFAAGEFNPGSQDGRRLLAHELVHTVQQGELRTSQPKLQISQPADASELEADRVANALVTGGPAQVSSIHQAAPHVALEPEAAKPAEARAEDTPAGRLPFKGKLPGEGGWDGDAIIKTSGVDAGSELGKATLAGTDEVLALTKKITDQAFAEVKAWPAIDEYWSGLLGAGLTATVFSIGVMLVTATYDDLKEFAVIADLFAKGGDEKKKGIIKWNQAQAAKSAQAAPAPAPQPPADAPAAAQKTERDDLRSKAESIVRDVLPAKYSAPPDSEEKKKWIKFFGNADIAKIREHDPNYTTCGALPYYLLNQLKLVPDQGLMSGGLGGLREGIQIFVNQTKDNPKGEPLKKKKTPENLAEVRKSYGPAAWIDDDGMVYKGGARQLGVSEQDLGASPQPEKPDPDKSPMAKPTAGAWVNHTGGDERPAAGDIYMLEGAINANDIKEKNAKPQIGIRHVGVFLKRTIIDKETETWETGDAGQGKGVDQEAKDNPRIYHTKDRTVTGGAEEEKDSRVPKPRVVGWINLDKVQLMSEMSPEDRRRYIESRLAESYGGGGSKFVQDAILTIFENTPKLERKPLYEKIEGHKWEGEFKTGKTVKDTDRLFRVMDVTSSPKDADEKVAQKKVRERRKKLKDFLDEN